MKNFRMKVLINREFFDMYEGENVAMWCKREEYAEEFSKLMHEQGLKWNSDKSYLKGHDWDTFKEKTVYLFNTGCYGSIDKYKDKITVLDFEDYIISEDFEDFYKNRHLELCKDIHQIYKSKNEKYGDSFNDTIEKYGMIAALTRMSDKFARIENNIVNEINDDEKLEDNLLDLANYCLMTIISIEKNKY